MVTESTIRLLETRIAEKYRNHLVPFDKAYPTSGQVFVRLAGKDLSIDLSEEVVILDIQVTVTCSARLRTSARQNEYKPYLAVIDIAEKIFFWLLSYQELRGELQTLFPQSSVTGRMESGHLSLEPIPVHADFYDSTEVHSRGPAGLKIDQTIMLPRIRIPMLCGNLPEWLQDAIGKPIGTYPQSENVD